MNGSIWGGEVNCSSKSNPVNWYTKLNPSIYIIHISSVSLLAKVLSAIVTYFVSGDSGEPLTIFQLQKQLWEEAAQPGNKGTLREELIKKIEDKLAGTF